jgi:hypothetical protein
MKQQLTMDEKPGEATAAEIEAADAGAITVGAALAADPS